MEALTPPEVTNALLALGVKKCRQGYVVTFGKSWFAGWILCFGAMVVQLIQGGSGELRTQYPGLITLVAAFFFPIGLIMLVLTGQDLCTANFMLVGMTCLKKKTKLWELPVNWIIVFFGNLAGALCYLAFMAHYSDLYQPEAMITFSRSVAVAKTSQDWGACVLRGIGCNFLVCMAIWLGAGARDIVSKCVVLHFPIMAFVFLGFEHVIVNMFYIPIGMVNGADVSVATYIGRSMIPSLIGNIIGGLMLCIPMVLMHQPLELELPTMFNMNKGSRARTESVVVREGDQSGSESSNGSLETGGVSPPSEKK